MAARLRGHWAAPRADINSRLFGGTGLRRERCQRSPHLQPALGRLLLWILDVPGQTNRQMPYYATFTAANTLTAGQWVDIEGLSTASGMVLNRTVAQVAASGLSSTQFTVGIPYSVGTVGTTADSGTATTVNVAVAFDEPHGFSRMCRTSLWVRYQLRRATSSMSAITMARASTPEPVCGMRKWPVRPSTASTLRTAEST